MNPPLVRENAIPWKPLVICREPQMVAGLRSTLLDLGLNDLHLVTEYPREGTLARMAAQHGCNICFLDIASNQEQALPLISDAAPALPVVALNTHKDADLILRCMRRGAYEYLSETSPEQVRLVLERLERARSPQPQSRNGSVTCVVPGKPGCGASTLAAHLAVQVHAGRGAKVLLVDTDALCGSIAFILKLTSEFHLGDVMRDWKRMDDDLWLRLVTTSAGIHVLPSPKGPGTRIDLGSGQAGELCAFWRQRYDLTVVDTPDARAAVEGGFAASADQVLLTTTNELAALHATRRSIEYLDDAVRDRSRIRLIVNRYTPAAGLRREDLKTALQIEPFAILNNDYECIQSALLDGKPAPANSRFASSVRALVRQLEGGSAAEKKAPSWFERIRRRR